MIGGAISSEQDIDAIAAALRADTADSAVLLDVLAMKLQDALPDFTQVVRHGVLNRSRHHVKELSVTVDQRRFTLRDDHKRLIGSITHVVHGVDLSTKQADLDEWLKDLAHELSNLAGTQTRAREALDRLLLGPPPS